MILLVNRTCVIWLLAAVLSGCNVKFLWFDNNESQIESATVAAPNSVQIQQSGSTQLQLQLSPGQTIQLSVVATYAATLSASPLNSDVIWASSNNNVLTVSSTGLVEAQAFGSASITATVRGTTSEALSVNVIEAYLTSLSLSPASDIISLSESHTVVATGTYSDGSEVDVSSQVVWSSSNPSIASVAAGATTQLTTGDTTISASFEGISSSNDTDLTVVILALQSIDISPTAPSFDFDGSQVFTATGTYNEGTVADLTSSAIWASSDTGTATFSGSTMSGIATGTTTVTASVGAITSNAVTATVNSLALCGGAVDDADPNTATGECLKVISEAVTDNLFTGTPSEALMLRLGYTANATSTNSGKTYALFKSDSSVTGSPENFAKFQHNGLNWDDDFNSPTYGKDGAYDRYCAHLASIRFNAKDNWRRSTIAEITSLRTNMGNLSSGYGWAGIVLYVSSTETNSGDFFARSLSGTHRLNAGPSASFYASCVSVP